MKTLEQVIRHEIESAARVARNRFGGVWINVCGFEDLGGIRVIVEPRIMGRFDSKLSRLPERLRASRMNQTKKAYDLLANRLGFGRVQIRIGKHLWTTNLQGRWVKVYE